MTDEKIQEQKATVLAFQSLLNTPNGDLILKKLSKMCNENEPTHVDQNPTGSSYKEGQRSVILGIRKMLNKNVNIVKQEKAVT